jgi:hypothetical protein
MVGNKLNFLKNMTGIQKYSIFSKILKILENFSWVKNKLSSVLTKNQKKKANLSWENKNNSAYVIRMQIFQKFWSLIKVIPKNVVLIFINFKKNHLYLKIYLIYKISNSFLKKKKNNFFCGFYKNNFFFSIFKN